MDYSMSTRKKKSWSKKKVSGLFKKSTSTISMSTSSYDYGKERKGGKGGEEANNGAGAESLSIEETNRMRASLGLKPLKQ